MSDIPHVWLETRLRVLIIRIQRYWTEMRGRLPALRTTKCKESQVSTKQLEERDAFLLKYFVASKKQCKTGLTTAVNCNQQREGGIIGFNPAPIFYHLLYNRDAFFLKYFVASKNQCKTGLTTAVNCNQQREGGIIGFNPAPIFYHLPYNLTLLIENI